MTAAVIRHMGRQVLRELGYEPAAVTLSHRVARYSSISQTARRRGTCPRVVVRTDASTP